MRGLYIWEREVVRWILIVVLLGLSQPSDHLWSGWVFCLALALILVVVSSLPLKTDVLLNMATTLLGRVSRRPERDLADRATAALQQIREE